MVISNADGVEATDEQNQQRRDAGLEAGVHFLSSDIPAPDQDRAYWLEIPGGTPARCNPISAPLDCTPEALEDL